MSRKATQLTFLAILVLLCIQPVFAQDISSCLDSFREFDALELESDSTIQTDPSIAWYQGCILVGSETGLWLYDLLQVENPIQLARGNIGNIATNPQTSTIAFNVVKESQVYVINSSMPEIILKASGDAVTDITFSPDGSFTAIASSLTIEYEGAEFPADGRVEIWDGTYKQIAELSSESGIVVDSFFTADNNNLIMHGADWGYIGDHIEFWDLDTKTQIWNYGDLVHEIEVWSDTDPLVSMMSTQNRIMAIGGLHGFLDWDDYYGTGVQIWNVDSDPPSRLSEIIFHNRGGSEDNNYLTSMALSPDATILATAQNKGIIRLWNTTEGKFIREVHVQSIAFHQIAFSENGSQLVLANETTIIVFDVETMGEIVFFSGINPE